MEMEMGSGCGGMGWDGVRWRWGGMRWDGHTAATVEALASPPRMVLCRQCWGSGRGFNASGGGVSGEALASPPRMVPCRSSSVVCARSLRSSVTHSRSANTLSLIHI
eukprot:5594894-Prymnesium_polylepis.1